MKKEEFKPFCYSGNKTRLLHLYRQLPEDTKRIVEPFAGSLVFSLQYDLPILAADNDERLVNLFLWLKSINEYELVKLHKWYMSKTENFDIRDIHFLNENQKNYIRLNAGSKITGFITKHKIYRDCKKINIDKTIKCLDKIKNLLEIKHCDFSELELKDGDIVFLDPPYIGSGYLYSNKKIDNLVTKIPEFISKYPNIKFIFTHGDDSKELFPQYNWEFLTRITFTKSQKDVSTKRVRDEFVAYINW